MRMLVLLLAVSSFWAGQKYGIKEAGMKPVKIIYKDRIIIQTEQIKIPDKKTPSEFEVTFYCDRGFTRSGCMTRTGSVAIDPAVVPMGTRIRTRGFNQAVPEWLMADDTGGAVKGNVIDIFLWSEVVCYQYGRQKGRAVWRQDKLGKYLLIERIK